MVKFYKDNFNARFTWDWVDGEFTTDDSALIENYKGLGLRWKDVEKQVTFKQAAEMVAPVEQPTMAEKFVNEIVVPELKKAGKRRGRKPKAK
jgi:translation elongation factor EF-Tu-like GTPase